MWFVPTHAGWLHGVSRDLMFGLSHEGATLGIDIRAKSDATTLCNITGHSYFNFTGAPTITDHQLQVAASEVLGWTKRVSPVEKNGCHRNAV